MRKAQKDQAKGFLRILDQVHDEILKYMRKNMLPEIMELLGQCQEGAIQLGSLIEDTEGEGFVTVEILEEYCEYVYQLHELLQQGQRANVKETSKALRTRLAQIERSVEQDIRVRTEVVFLPYKASMWDSLESVWKAADEDPDCDAYVVPIPYYDKNPDGSFREMHYEGDLYPDDVPVTGYEDYDFKGRKPDIIFIHNPYDNANYVTSVHPFFFSSNLKQFTDKLIYIPYFILNEIKPDNKAAIDGMKHFCTTPGVYNADQVIVQSEDMRQIYIDVLTEASGNKVSKAAVRHYWENKISGAGSPKVDKVLNTTKEDITIPEEWKKVIQKPDGSIKKIIFYNTSVGTFLRQNGKMLEKMREVFQTFESNKDEIALLWRPHPLMEATIESMRADLYGEYMRLKQWFIEEKIGIYDETPDMYTAIALSDGYYGDWSSLVPLYQKTGKPVMIQNVEIM